MRKHTSIVLGHLIVFLAIAGCAPAARGPAGGGVGAVSARALPAPEAFADLERRLLTSERLDFDFRITAEGQFDGRLDGTLAVRGDSAIRLTASGEFGGQPMTLTLSVADGRMRGGNGQQQFDEAIPTHLAEALVIGLTRMGILHNLSRLAAGQPPDRADGTVTGWVEVRDVEWEDESGGVEAPELEFDIAVSGQVMGEAELTLDALGRPAVRDQTVRFSAGEMRVREAYTFRSP